MRPKRPARAVSVGVPDMAGLPDESLTFLREAYQAIRRSRIQILQGFDLSLSEYFALALCAQSPAMPSDIADAAGVTAAGATDIIDRLEQRRLVARKSHPKDRRALLVMATPSGRRLVDKARAAQRAIWGSVRLSMTVDERRALHTGLAALVRSLPASSHAPG